MVCLFVNFVISIFRFEARSLVIIAPVLGHCLLLTFGDNWKISMFVLLLKGFCSYSLKVNV